MYYYKVCNRKINPFVVFFVQKEVNSYKMHLFRVIAHDKMCYRTRKTIV